MSKLRKLKRKIDDDTHYTPDDPSYPVLVGDVVLGEQGVGLLLVKLDADVPGVVAVHLVQLTGVRTVHAHEALEVWPEAKFQCFN